MPRTPQIHDQDAEVAVIGSLLIDCSQFSEVSFLQAEDFFDGRHRRMFQAIRAMNGKGVDEVTLAHQMSDMGIFEALDCAWMAHCLAQTPTSVHAKYYARIVKDYSERRKGIKRAGEMAKAAYSGKVKRLKPIQI